MNIILKIIHKLLGYRCPECQGDGITVIGNGWTARCPTCDGKGRVWKKE
jgi:DnaJ-class molecular chaperone